MKRILYINDVIFSNTSGELTHTVGILNALSNKNIYIDYIVLEENIKILKQEGIDSRISLIVVKSLGTKRLKRLQYYLKVNLLSKDKYSFIYLRESFFTFLCIPMSFKYGNKIYLEYNGLRQVEVNNIILKGVINFFGWLNRLQASHIKFNIAVAKGIEEFLVTKWFLKNAITINNGSDLKKDSDIFLLKKKKIISFIGNLAYWQNFDFLINLIETNRNYLMEHEIVFHIYGNGKEFNRLHMLIDKLKLNNLIQLKGMLLKKEIGGVLSNSSAGILIDTRFLNKKPLFSPLKMYEYNIFNIPTIFFIKEDVEPLQKEGFFIINETNFSTIHDILNKQYNLKSLTRTWDDTANEFINLFDIK